MGRSLGPCGEGGVNRAKWRPRCSYLPLMLPDEVWGVWAPCAEVSGSGEPEEVAECSSLELTALHISNMLNAVVAARRRSAGERLAHAAERGCSGSGCRPHAHFSLPPSSAETCRTGTALRAHFASCLRPTTPLCSSPRSSPRSLSRFRSATCSRSWSDSRSCSCSWPH